MPCQGTVCDPHELTQVDTVVALLALVAIGSCRDLGSLDLRLKYSVHDPHTGDVKSQAGTREGDHVWGFYTLKEADGTTREVHYTADKHSGFNDEVERIGHAVHPQYHHHHDQGSYHEGVL